MVLVLVGVIIVGLLIILGAESQKAGERLADHRQREAERAKKKAEKEWTDKYGRVD